MKSKTAASVLPLILACSTAFAARQPKKIVVHAKRFAFVPSEITLATGQPVKLVLISDDVAHGLVVQGVHLDASFRKHHRAEVVLTPSEIGDFPGSCSVFCGAGHGEMKFIVHVVNPARGK